MNLDELKEAWTALDNKLRKNEELKEMIILEMIKKKAGRIVNRFIVWEIISVVVLLFVLPFCVYWLDRNGGKYLIGDILLCYSLAICIIYPIWGIFKIHGLMKFDFLKDIGSNIFCINRYNIQIKCENKIFWVFIWPVIMILIILHFSFMTKTLPLWMLFFMISWVVMGTLLSYWTYKKYNKDITSILRSLDEIKELKEE